MIESFQEKNNTLGKIKFYIYLPVYDPPPPPPPPA